MIKCNLAVLMAERGLNIQDVSNATKLSRTTISALVNENGKGIQFDTMNDLCELLKVTPGQLFTHISLSNEIQLISFDDVSIDEKWHSEPIDEKNDLETHELNITCTATLDIKIIQNSLRFEGISSFRINMFVINGQLRTFRYGYKAPNGLDVFFEKLQFFIKESIIENIEEVLLEGAHNHLEEIESLFVTSIDSEI